MAPAMVLWDGFGVMFVMVTGPWTHGSPFTNVPVGRSEEKYQVMPQYVTELAALAEKLSKKPSTAHASGRPKIVRRIFTCEIVKID